VCEWGASLRLREGTGLARGGSWAEATPVQGWREVSAFVFVVWGAMGARSVNLSRRVRLGLKVLGGAWN